MKITGYRKVFSEGGVTVAERVETEISFQSVVARSLAPLDAMPQQGIHAALASRRSFEEERPRDGGPVSFTGDGGREIRVEGIVFWASLTGMVSFFLDRYITESDGLFDGLVKTARNGDSGARAEIETLITRDGMPTRPGRRRQRRLSRNGPPVEPTFPCVKMEDFLENDGKRVSLPGGEHYFCTASSRSEMGLIARQDLRRIGGLEIPRLAFLAPTGDWLNDRSEATDASYLIFDGECTRWLKTLEDLPPSEMDAFDARGTVLSRSAFDIFPCPHLKSRCLVRIPGRGEMEAFVQANPSQRRPRRSELARPALVRDSREPVPLGSKIPVVTSASAAFFVLSRLVKGIYLPGDAFHPFPVNRLPEAESYLVLCEPVELM